MITRHSLHYMYDYQKIIEAISCAIDTDDLDRIIENFIDSLSAHDLEQEIIEELYSNIENKLLDTHYEMTNRMKRALVLLEIHLT